MTADPIILGGKEFASRLILGSGKLFSDKLIPEIIKASGAEVITVALRRVDVSSADDNILDNIPSGMQLMPNTSGARNAAEAVKIAEIARATGCGDWVKIEIMTDNKYLMPNGYETVKATEILAEKGFKVFPYMNPDLYIGRDLVKAGAAAVMPLGAPIGSNRGLRTSEMIRILIEEIDLPIIVDAGIGKPSDACKAMEMGVAACMINTAIATANDPVDMGLAFKYAIEAGRKAYLSGLAGEQVQASASSPLTGFLHD